MGVSSTAGRFCRYCWLYNLKTTATASGLYFPRYSSGNSGQANYWRGYHLTFNGNGTVTVRRVSGTTSLSSTRINPEDTLDRTLISNESLYGTYTIPANCGLIFVEDNLWIDGVNDRKVTVVAANVTTTGVEPNVMLPGNLTYLQLVLTDSRLLQRIMSPLRQTPQNDAERSLYRPGGAFGRNLYSSWYVRAARYSPFLALPYPIAPGKWVNGGGRVTLAISLASTRLIANSPQTRRPLLILQPTTNSWIGDRVGARVHSAPSRGKM